MKLRGALLILLIGLVFFSHQALSDALGDPKTYGPYICGDCAVGYPAPDPVTKSIIDWAENSYAPVLIGFSPGDKIIVCSDFVCVTYVQSQDGKYYGEKRELRIPPPGGGGGPGGPSPDPGGIGGDDPLGTCMTHNVKACTSAGGGGQVCEYQTVLEC